MVAAAVGGAQGISARVSVSGLYWKTMMFGIGINIGAENWISAPFMSLGERE